MQEHFDEGIRLAEGPAPALRLLARALAGGDRTDWAARLRSGLAAPSDPLERTLLLHIGAAAATAARDAASLEKFLTEASELEAAAGLRIGSQHTLHQLALLTNYHLDLRSVTSYYRATAATLRSQRHAAGLALCYRSLGEVLLALGKIPDALRYWKLAEQALRQSHKLEADQLAVWMAALAPADLPDGR